MSLNGGDDWLRERSKKILNDAILNLYILVSIFFGWERKSGDGFGLDRKPRMGKKKGRDDGL